jgi:putative SOS response-associated peptidase YedK
MCGRYRLSRRKQILAEHFDAVPFEDDWIPRYNIAPTQPVPVIRQHPKEPRRVLSLMRWGLIPSWATDPGIGEDDQCTVRDDHDYGVLPRSPQNATVSDSSGRLL